jgi:hypothetical protein
MGAGILAHLGFAGSGGHGVSALAGHAVVKAPDLVPQPLSIAATSRQPIVAATSEQVVVSSTPSTDTLTADLVMDRTGVVPRTVGAAARAGSDRT